MTLNNILTYFLGGPSHVRYVKFMIKCIMNSWWLSNFEVRLGVKKKNKKYSINFLCIYSDTFSSFTRAKYFAHGIALFYSYCVYYNWIVDEWKLNFMRSVEVIAKVINFFWALVWVLWGLSGIKRVFKSSWNFQKLIFEKLK